MPAFEKLRQAIEDASNEAENLFYSNTEPKDRKTYFEKGKLGDNGKGAVYAYFSEDGKALYVGQAGRRIKLRQHDQTSPHKSKPWWGAWETVRFIQVSNETDRIALEYLLIIALKPPYNSKPGAREIQAMFSS
ncbi:GIY-YIG nuclease family protein [Pseudomonas sp. Teo4]|uniref:GIY-YIG nuclease family protein n=1 Tax=Pseudomonas sp. Teo4 TaxID=3064528 RepID=UPI002ABC118D|nr:GIY-YIG nuclease family protein [Pseudomonas sp. Teo4]MDZ3992422.1 hypothetical protein [Pseudomonas sp. Teo4]